ncbi:MAG: hypothetical protein IBX40_12255, partial [Methanosarcinales archaeon]|nr:hypothetical protein [Methanosarcinales archaeon]
TFGSALIIVILVTIKPDREKWQTVGKIIIFLVIFSSLLNAIFFIYWQVEYPDRSQNGIVEASKWLNENTPANATIQSSIWELPGWININKPLHPEMKYPRSTFLSHYVYRTTYAPPGNEKDFLTRIENKEIDYIVIFTDPTLTSSEHAKNIYDYLQNYVDEAPAGSELIYSEFKNQKVLFRIYKVL